jgi:CHAT domain-containing protein
MSKNSAAANAVMENMSRSIIADEYGKTLLRAYQGQKAVVELHLNNLSAFSANAKEQSDSKLEFQELTDAISREELKLRDLETELRKRHPEYFDFTRASNIEFEEARRLLSADEALVLIYSDDGRRGDYIWVITKEAERWLKLNTEPREIESSVSRLISQLTPNSSTTVDVTLAYELYQKTLGSLDNILEEKSHLIFVLDGPLASLPPHVFVTNDPTDQELKDVEWLIKRHAVTILPTVRTLSLLREDSIPSIPLKPMRAYADIIYSPDGERGNVVFDQRAIADVFTDGVADASLLAKASPLPATGPEVRSVMATLGGSNEDIVSGRAATELDVKQSNLLDYRVIYFATHGLLAAEVEELAKMRAEPALLLAVPQQASPQDDGLLTASEITQLKLNADWVVLSACNTAAGGKPGGAALSGLAQSFLHAGSRALLVSHWPVDDEATRTLMIKLFESYKVDGSIGAEALRSAMLGVMTDVDHPDWANPTYWAPFIIVGEPRTSTQ